MATTAPNPPAPSGPSGSGSSYMDRRWAQFRHLDEAAYTRDVARLDSEQLTALHGRLKRKLIASSMGTAHGVWTAPATGGFSLVASGVAGRQTHVNVRRLRIVEARMAERQAARYQTRKRDYAIPAGCLGLASAVAGHCEGFFADHLASENACQAADVAAGMAQEPLYGALYHRVSAAGSATQLTSVQLAQGTPVASGSAGAPQAAPAPIPSVPSPSLHPQAAPALPPRPASVDPIDAQIPPALPPRPEPLFELEGALAPALPPRPASALGTVPSAATTSDPVLALSSDSLVELPDTSKEPLSSSPVDQTPSTPLPPLIAVIPPPDEVAPPENAPCVVEAEAIDDQITPAAIPSEKQAIKDHIAAAYPPAVPDIKRIEEPIRKGRPRATSSPESEMPYFPPPPTYEASIAARPAYHPANYAHSDVKAPISVEPVRMPSPHDYTIPAYNPADYVR